MGFDFIVIAPLLPSHCGSSFVFACGVSFLVSSNVFLSMTVQQLVVMLVLSPVGMSARPSSPPYCPLPLVAQPPPHPRWWLFTWMLLLTLAPSLSLPLNVFFI